MEESRSIILPNPFRITDIAAQRIIDDFKALGIKSDRDKVKMEGQDMEYEVWSYVNMLGNAGISGFEEVKKVYNETIGNRPILAAARSNFPREVALPADDSPDFPIEVRVPTLDPAPTEFLTFVERKGKF